jgi:hypothetical protein
MASATRDFGADKAAAVATGPPVPGDDDIHCEDGFHFSDVGEDAMAYDVPVPEKRPEPGYYYHYKHDRSGPLNNYAYYIYGIGHHTEDNCRAEDAFMQVYRPLYEEAYAYRNGGIFDLRPLHMFYEPAKWNGEEVQRFTRITDPEVIARLREIRARMYPAHVGPIGPS